MEYSDHQVRNRKWGANKRRGSVAEGGGQLKINKLGVAVNRGGVKRKHTIFCLRRSTHSQFIPSFRVEQCDG